MSHGSARPGRDEDGFTLVELLVVMIVIGILASIAVPLFLSQRAKAQEAATKTDVSKVGKEVATAWVDAKTTPTVALTSGRYLVAGSDVGKASGNIALQTTNVVDDRHWCVALTNAKATTPTWKYSAAGGLAAGDCTAADVA